MLKKKMHYTCISCIAIDPAMRTDEKKLSTILFKRMQI